MDLENLKFIIHIECAEKPKKRKAAEGKSEAYPFNAKYSRHVEVIFPYILFDFFGGLKELILIVLLMKRLKN